MEEKWNMELSIKADIFKEKLENRSNHVVSYISFHEDMKVIEEENLSENNFYTDRKIRIFIGNGVLSKFKFGDISEEEKVKELEKILTTAMRVAENKLIKLMHYKEGEITFHHGVS